MPSTVPNWRVPETARLTAHTRDPKTQALTDASRRLCCAAPTAGGALQGTAMAAATIGTEVEAAALKLCDGKWNAVVAALQAACAALQRGQPWAEVGAQTVGDTVLAARAMVIKQLVSGRHVKCLQVCGLELRARIPLGVLGAGAEAVVFRTWPHGNAGAYRRPQ